MPEQNSHTVSLHIGAHKTATTHLQQCIYAARDDISAQGVRFLGPQELRGDGASLAKRFLNVNAQDLATARSSVWKDATRLVLSEENFIGTLIKSSPKMRKPLYPDAGTRIAKLATAIAPHGIVVFLSIRNPTGFLNSAYSQYLRAGGRETVDVFKKANPISCVNWVKLLEQLRGNSGIRSLIVWPYEDYEALFSRITALMLGAKPAAQVNWVDDRVYEGLSRATVSNILAGSTNDEESDRKFDAYGGQEHARSGVFYADQLEEIVTMRHVTFLRA